MKLKQLLAWLWLIHGGICLVYSITIKDDTAKQRFFSLMSMLSLILAKLNDVRGER